MGSHQTNLVRHIRISSFGRGISRNSDDEVAIRIVYGVERSSVIIEIDIGYSPQVLSFNQNQRSGISTGEGAILFCRIDQANLGNEGSAAEFVVFFTGRKYQGATY